MMIQQDPIWVANPHALFCLSLSQLPNKMNKLLTVTSETRKYFIHSDRYLTLFNTLPQF